MKGSEIGDDVVLIEPDPQVIRIDLAAPGGMQIAQGSPQTDTDGTGKDAMKGDKR